ncbi:MAG TPA: hypothetical protein VM511_10125 [Luteolibacter sp.]|nr:hypothetical protein [Luteolibacter sp.]
MKTNRSAITGLLLGLILPQAVSAALITFSADADYDANFREYGTAVSRNGTLNMLQKSGAAGGAVSAIYNTTATGGTGGNGGTGVASVNNNTFSDFRIQMDFSAEALLAGGNSLGFFVKVNSAENSGYLGVFRLTGANSADFRMFDSDSNPNGAPSGTVLNSTTAFSGITAGSITVGTFYTLRLDVQDVGGTVQFAASIFTQGGGTQIGNTITTTDTTSPVLGAGQVGLRMGTQGGTVGSNYFDNFSVEAIPEPQVAMLSLAGLAVVCIRRRK